MWRRGKDFIYNLWKNNRKVKFEKEKIEDYLIDDIGVFKCSLSEIENPINSKRKHKIICT